MTNKELIKEILLATDEYGEKELKKLKKDELIEILEFANLEDVDDDWVEDEEDEEEVVIDISKLSKYEQRHYAKTGQLPQSTINKYTRFDNEDVQTDF